MMIQQQAIFLRPFAVVALLTLSTSFSTALSFARAPSRSRPNVLFIAVDDLRPQILSFGRKNMLTPNLDRLAKRGVIFQRATAWSRRAAHRGPA